MTDSSAYCDSCGASNLVQAIYCVACKQPLHAILPVGNSHASVGKSNIAHGPLALGHLLQQRYSIVEQVGTGGFGAVYRARDTLFSNRPLAIKEVNQDGLKPRELAEAIAAFQHEALLLAGLRHPNLPRIYGQFAEGGRYYVVMDFIEGDTLEDYQDKVIPRLPVRDVLDIGLQLCAVLDYLHTRQPPIIFRDVKPDNIMRTSNGHIYLIDFGIARHFKLGKAKDTIPLGSKGYAAPEQYGKAQTTPQTDIYGLGATLHQLLTGDDPSLTPFHFESVTLYQSPLSVQLDKLLEQMVAMDMSKRPASMNIVRQELQDLLAKLAAGHLSAIQQAAQARTARRRFLLGSAKVLAACAGSAAASIFIFARLTAPPITPSTANPTMLHPLIGTTPVALASTPTEPAGGFTYLSTPLSTYNNHRGAVTAVAWSPNGTYIASAGAVDQTVQVWKPATGNSMPPAIFDTGGQSVDALAWSPDSTKIAAALDNDTLQAWSIATRSNALSLSGDSGNGNALAYSPDGSRIAAVSGTSFVNVWSITTKKLLFTYIGQTKAVSALAWSPHGPSSSPGRGPRIVSGGIDGDIQVWEVANNTKTLLTYSGHKQAISAVAWSFDGRYIASSSVDGTAQIWDATMGSKLFTYRGHNGPVNAVAWAPGYSYRLASAGADGTVQVWSLAPEASGQALAIAGKILVCRGHSGQVLSLSWSPDGPSSSPGRGRSIASASEDATVQIWQTVF